MNGTVERRKIAQNEGLANAAYEAGMESLADAIDGASVQSCRERSDETVDLAMSHIVNGREVEARQALGL